MSVHPGAPAGSVPETPGFLHPRHLHPGILTSWHLHPRKENHSWRKNQNKSSMVKEDFISRLFVLNPLESHSAVKRENHHCNEQFHSSLLLLMKTHSFASFFCTNIYLYAQRMGGFLLKHMKYCSCLQAGITDFALPISQHRGM